MAQFEQYQHIEKLESEETLGILYGTCYIFPKIDGCFDYRTRILLADGTYECIGKIVNQKMEVDVLSFDLKNKKIVKNKIINWYKYTSKNEEEWLTLNVCRTAGGLSRGGGRNTNLICTKNHCFIKNYETDESIEAKDLKVGDFVYIPQHLPTSIQKQLLIGTLLGDGSAYPNNSDNYINGISFSHSIKQKEYINYKIKLLGNLYNNTRNLTSGFGSEILSVNTVCNKITQNIYEYVYKNNKKTITKELLSQLNSLGIAIWYMDDGSISKNINMRDKANFHVDNFLDSEKSLIKDYFDTLGYYCHLRNNGKENNKTFIVLTPEGTENLFYNICQYIIPSMQYKLSEKFKNKRIDIDSFLSEENEIGLIQRKIMKITQGKKDCYFKQGNFKFDIEIENTHTYFAENVLVHNSNASVWLDSTGKLCAGSRKRELTLDSDNAGFFNDICTDLRISKFFNEYPNIRLYGEWLVPHTLKTYRSEVWRKFYVFDATYINATGEDKKYIPYDQYTPILEKFGIDYIPVQTIINNPSLDQLYHEIDKNTFLIGDGKGVGEGIVIKNYNFVNKFKINQLFAKIVTTEFKEKHRREMGPNILNGEKTLEIKIVEEFCTEALIDKVCAKIVNEENGWNGNCIPRLLNTVYHDLITEEMWNILKKYKGVIINFKTLQMLVFNKIKTYKGTLF